MTYVRTVREFTVACNEGIPQKPQFMTQEQIKFIEKMVNDEMKELASATSVTEQADALVDAIYYLCDCAVKQGMNLDPLFEIVHAANMAKVVDGKVLKRDDGKILKPEGWKDPKPALEQEMGRQSKENSF